MSGFNPCPFCGSTDVSRSWQSAALIAIECAKCEATGPARKGDSTQEAKDGARDAWNTRVSPWRSLKDYKAPEDIDATILLRRTERLAWMLCGPLGRRRTIELAMADGFDEYMEVPS